MVEWDERDHPTQTEDRLERAQDIARVRKAVEQLDDKSREVIELHWFEGLSFKEISHVTGVGVSALKVRAHRTYKKLREALKQ
jgi:RNA polymerase sigma-70 factor (ECF subfamily)